ncbi:hypothetical protein J8Y16_26890 (plasmid) [Bacillus cereus]|uniref:hypothetical protein n=1 Tax=Bacillus cereus TaxID=1396 RepID=UPI001BB42D60|nr:hypothetical protein [Bacillus cereus]QUW29233.1 hypothetical protein J8Y16_26890 [Bacillus cereus]
MKRLVIIFLCAFCIVSHTIPVFADTPSFQLLGSKGVSIENKGLVGGKYSLVLRVNDAEDVVTFQLSELMLVNDCSFNLGKAKWTRPSQEKNEFEINWEMNGTYAFYIFVNGKVKGYARFKLTGFPKNGEGGGTTQYTGNMAKYYELPPENFDPNDFADYDNKLDGVCTNEKLPDKPHGSGDIEEPKDNNNNKPTEGGGGSDKAVKEALEKIVNAVNEISKNTGETAKNTGETAKNTGEIKKNTDEIAKNTKEIADAVKDIRDNLKIPDDMDLSIKPVLPEDIKPDKPKQPDKPFEDKQEHFKEGEQEKPPDKLPVAPEPAECWGDVCKDKDNQKEEDMKKDKDMDKEEPMKPDKPMEKEDMKPDKPMTPDKPMEKEDMKPDKPMTPDKPMDREGEMKKDNDMKQDKPMTPWEEMKPSDEGSELCWHVVNGKCG